jgi:hypothetical protein
MLQTGEALAIEGGSPAVPLPHGDRWNRSNEEVEAVAETLRATDVYDPTALLEREFASLVGTRHAVAVCNGTPMTPGRTPFGYGRVHTAPVPVDFLFERSGGPRGGDCGDTRRPAPPGGLPVTEALARQVFWRSTPVDPDPRWQDQIASASRRVVEGAPLLARAG